MFGPALPQSGGSFEIRKSVIAGGGGRSAGGAFVADGTVGQSVAGTTSTGGTFSIGGGFWGTDGAGGTPTPTMTPTATPTPGGGGFESDVSPRTSGDGIIVSGDVVQMRRFATGLDIPNGATNEFQRADAAPRATLGDGAIASGDVTQARRYATGLDEQTAAGGPTAPASLPQRDVARSSRALRVVSRSAVNTSQVVLPVILDAQGGETAMRFTLTFDGTKLTRPSVALMSAIADGPFLTVNDAIEGELTVLVDSQGPIARGFAAEIVRVTFDVVPAAAGPTEVSFAQGKTSVSDEYGNELAIEAADATVTFSSERFDNVEVSGRIVSRDGRGVRSASVTITDPLGATRSVVSSSFGYYRFDGLAVGETYTISIASKRHTFTARTLRLAESLADVNLVGN